MKELIILTSIFCVYKVWYILLLLYKGDMFRHYNELKSKSDSL